MDLHLLEPCFHGSLMSYVYDGGDCMCTKVYEATRAHLFPSLSLGLESAHIHTPQNVRGAAWRGSVGQAFLLRPNCKAF